LKGFARRARVRSTSDYLTGQAHLRIAAGACPRGRMAPEGHPNPHPPHGPPPWLFELFGGRKRRAERGEVRYLILDALREQPRHGYEVISVDQLVEALQTQDPDLLPPRSVVITVDDGYRCVYDFAWPVLAEYGYPFAVYIYTNYVAGGGNSMTWSEIRDLASDDLVTIGAHSISHGNLADPRKARGPYDAWVRRELAYPKNRLEAETGKPVRTFAWPYGSFNSFALSVAIQTGYEGILTVLPGANSMESSPYSRRSWRPRCPPSISPSNCIP